MKHTKVITLSLVFLVLLAGSLWWYVTESTDTERPSQTPAAATSTATSTEQDQDTAEPTPDIPREDWETYTNEEYGFSLEYPCDEECEIEEVKDNGYYLYYVSLPTNDDQARVGIGIFTMESLDEWYKRTASAQAEPMRFAFDYKKLEDFLAQPIGNNVDLNEYNIYKNLELLNEKGRIVELNGKKAIKEPLSKRKYEGVSENYYIKLYDDLWMQIRKGYYFQYRKDPILNSEVPRTTLEDQKSASGAVVNTLQF